MGEDEGSKIHEELVSYATDGIEFSVNFFTELRNKLLDDQPKTPATHTRNLDLPPGP